MHIILVLAKGKFETEEFVTVKEACQIAHRHRRTIDRWIKEGLLIPCYVGDEVCIREDQLRRVMLKRTKIPKGMYSPEATASTGRSADVIICDEWEQEPPTSVAASTEGVWGFSKPFSGVTLDYHYPSETSLTIEYQPTPDAEQGKK